MTIRVYTKPHCVQCDATKRHLDTRGIPYETDDITTPENLAAAKALGLTSAPVVETPYGVWAGYRPDLIDNLATRIEQENTK